ncbi:acyl-CoA dehydrogenase domain-containing protein, partial [Alteromonas sp. 14N.309.X.WAT.G.H12]|uniref:acyl-CoA dehydrogenase domain-containing protein n=1 Tax=Alteromonas sp. 14N.309.X.WAT.G.H12 TaxID=3120824 RepID=UPI002FD3F116
LRLLVLPFGRRCKKPSDTLEHTVAQILQTPSLPRTRLGDGQYLTREEGNLFGDLEQTLENIIAVEPIFDKICDNKGAKLSFTNLDVLADEALQEGWITEDEARLLNVAEAGRLRTINVDDFDHEELVAKINSQS